MYVQSDTLLANEFENFRNIYLKIYELNPSRFLLGLVAKLDWSKIRSFNWYRFLLMVEKGIRKVIFHILNNIFIDIKKLIPERLWKK